MFINANYIFYVLWYYSVHRLHGAVSNASANASVFTRTVETYKHLIITRSPRVLATTRWLGPFARTANAEPGVVDAHATPPSSTIHSVRLSDVFSSV